MIKSVCIIGYGSIGKKHHKIISSIFKWFEDDFESRGGVLKFIGNYLPPEIVEELRRSGIKVSYLDYNWDLNS